MASKNENLDPSGSTSTVALVVLAGLVSVGFMILNGCSSGKDQGSNRPGVKSPEKFESRGSASFIVPGDLCRYIRRARPGAGVFVVSKIVQYPYSRPGKTFVTLKKQKTWYSNRSFGDEVELVFNEGPDGANGWDTGRREYPNLATNERVGILIYPAEHFKGDYYTDRFGAFRREDGRYTNGTHFLNEKKSLKEVGSVVKDLNRGVEDGSGCPYEVPPESSWEPSDAGVDSEFAEPKQTDFNNADGDSD